MPEVRSRQLRKGRNRVTTLLGGDQVTAKRFGPMYWAPRSLAWWIGTLFMAGSACFAIGPVIAIVGSIRVATVTFFIGSLFFTAAAYSQFLEVINADSVNAVDASAPRVRLFAIDRKSIGWQACSIQLAGTLFFNVTTFTGLIQGLDAQSADRLVWAPDVFGSICFLVASWLALTEVRRNWQGQPDRGIEWSITALNMVGSIAFGVSAVGAYVIHDTDQLLNAAAANAGTFVGAICFFVGAYLLWPESARASTDKKI